MKNFRFVDLFCGGGGSITGAVNALRAAGEKYEGRGFNHWETAIRTIQANHPEIVPDFARACAPIQSVLPDEVFDIDPERIDVLWASPSCTHHSNAAGGKPRSNQLRSQPEYLLPFLRLTKCRRMFVENVRELLDWGPLLDKDTVFQGKKYHAGSPDPRKKGTFFNLWLREIRASGYAVDMQIMNAADYGAATSRERLIVQAVRKSSGERIVWPEPTHTKEPCLLSGSYLPWRSAAEVIDWTIPGKSIFDREKPLCKNTLQRIESGIRKYWGEWADIFIIALPVIDTSNRYSLIRPLFIPQQSAGTVKPVSEPVSTIAAGSIGIVRPFLIKYYSQGGAVPADIPLHTVTTKDRFGIIRGRIFTAPDGRTYQLDITHRMLTAGELAAAMSFPGDYVFCGGDTAAKKQIGNAVPPLLAEALYRAVLAA